LIFDIKFVVILHTFNPLSAKKPLNPKWKWKNASARLAFRLCRPYHFSIFAQKHRKAKVIDHENNLLKIIERFFFSGRLKTMRRNANADNILGRLIFTDLW